MLTLLNQTEILKICYFQLQNIVCIHFLSKMSLTLLIITIYCNTGSGDNGCTGEGGSCSHSSICHVVMTIIAFSFLKPTHLSPKDMQ